MNDVKDYDFELPSNLIAQVPIEKRDQSKMLVMDRLSGEISHFQFADIIDLLDNDCCLVLNDTKVIPARIIGIKAETGAVIELLLLNEIESRSWKALVKPSKRVKVGTVIEFSEKLKARCVATYDEGIREFELEYDGILYEILDELGSMPLPPYITEKLDDKDRYQTVYAKNLGSVAAPTAGLHFTNELLENIKKRGIEIITITLHVGLGTFRPVAVDNILDHKMHSEFYIIEDDAAKKLNEFKKNGRKIVSVGTTSTRVLESNFTKYGKFEAETSETDIFIYPGYKFNAIDQLITNFHLPKSTLVMLVSAFSERKKILNAYRCAIENEYRFFSFGDAMFIR